MTSTAPARAWYLTPEFTKFVPYLRAIPAHDTRAGRSRLELSSLTPRAVELEALMFTVSCVACGRSITPFRTRQRPPGRGRNVAGGTYLGVACRLTEGGGPGCSRGSLASRAYDQIKGLIEIARTHRKPDGQQSGFSL